MDNNQYKNIQQLEQNFIQGQLGQFPDTINVQGIEYKFLQHRDDVSWKQIVSNQSNKALTVYTIARNPENMARRQEIKSNPDDRSVPNDLLAFGWSITQQMRVVPIGNAFTTRSRIVGRVFESTDISYNEPATINGINGDQPFDSKVDTGADVCSLHADNIRMNGDTVTFEINGKSYTMSVHKVQNIRQADSQAEQRPVVLLNFTIAGEYIPNVECNLNDRSGMSSPLLIGKNLLSKHDFTIRTMQEAEQELEQQYSQPLDEDEWQDLDALFEDHQLTESQTLGIDQLTNKQIIEQILSSNVTLQELVQEAYRVGIEKGSDTSY